MAFLKHTLNNHEYEINTDLGDQISVRVIDTASNQVVADYTKPIAEELITLLESQYAHKSLIDIICISAQNKLHTVDPSFPIYLTEGKEQMDIETNFSAN